MAVHDPSARTFAQAKTDLLLRIRHATAGGTLPDLTGRRLDGVEEPLSAYRGRVVLIDFWATWCPPCIDALPELRELVADLPADRFALLAISLDEDLTTVLDFLETEPMPWDNWHAGVGSELERTLAARGVVPSYVRRRAGRDPGARLRSVAPVPMHGGARRGGRESDLLAQRADRRRLRAVEAGRRQGRSTVRRHSTVLCVSRSAPQINRAPSRHSIAS